MLFLARSTFSCTAHSQSSPMGLKIMVFLVGIMIMVFLVGIMIMVFLVVGKCSTSCSFCTAHSQAGLGSFGVRNTH